MTSPRPWETEYTIEDTTVIAETPDLRVLRITLAAGEAIRGIITAPSPTPSSVSRAR